jgi:transcriptional regulator with XRE-family HTH domain
MACPRVKSTVRFVIMPRAVGNLPGIWKISEHLDMGQRVYRLRAEEVEKLRTQLGLTIEQLARKAGEVHVKTLQRWLKGKPAYLRNIRALAIALKTKPEAIIDDPKFSPAIAVTKEPTFIELKIRIPVDPEHFDPKSLATFLTLLKGLTHSKEPIPVIDIEGGSTILKVRMEKKAAQGLPRYITYWKRETGKITSEPSRGDEFALLSELYHLDVSPEEMAAAMRMFTDIEEVHILPGPHNKEMIWRNDGRGWRRVKAPVP